MSTNVFDNVVDGTRVNSFHLMIMFWCSMLMLFDGYDLVIYGSVLPQLMVEWKLPAVTAGFIGSSALFGMMGGALTLGSSSDRFGRRRVILACWSSSDLPRSAMASVKTPRSLSSAVSLPGWVWAAWCRTSSPS